MKRRPRTQGHWFREGRPNACLVNPFDPTAALIAHGQGHQPVGRCPVCRPEDA